MANDFRKELLSGLKTLSIYRDLLEEPIFVLFMKLLDTSKAKKMKSYVAEILSLLLKENESANFPLYIIESILHSENPFSVHVAEGKVVSKTMQNLVKRDLQILQAASLYVPEIKEKPSLFSALPCWNNDLPQHNVLHDQWKDCYDALAEFHRGHGYGMFTQYKAFVWRNQQITPIKQTNPILFKNLKTYEKQRQQVIDNTKTFLAGLPASNALLYGDRGTGKSSTVHATLNEFAGQGLRMVEMPKSEIASFPKLIERLAPIQLKFIVFIDDLAISADDADFSELKAQLEGGLAAQQKHILIYATSNLRHLVRESFAQREENAVHASDVRHEQISLSDRFGLTITFINPSKEQFLTILHEIAKERGLAVDDDKLYQKAEQYALVRGGRSPRIAKQFIDMVEAHEKQGKGW